jgi:hypothetical protein
MKITRCRTILAILAIVVSLIGTAAQRVAADPPFGSAGWWQQMDREGRGGR